MVKLVVRTVGMLGWCYVAILILLLQQRIGVVYFGAR